MKLFKKYLFPATLVMFALCAAVTIFLNFRYQQAATAFQNSLSGKIELGKNGKIVMFGEHEQALANQRLYMFLAAAGLTAFWAIVLLVLVFLRRKERVQKLKQAAQAAD